MNVLKLVGTAWLVHDGSKGIVIDTGRQGSTRRLLDTVKSLRISVPIIFMTHTHYDHAGGTEALRCATGARVLVGASEASCLREGYTPVPQGTHAIGRLLSKAAHAVDSKKREHYPRVTQDIIEIDSESSLEPYDFDAYAVPLGAHTSGSVGLHIGDWFIAGDTVFGIGSKLYPPFADDLAALPAAWQTILGSGAHYICPGHGGIIKIEKLKKEYEKRFGSASDVGIEV